MCKKSLTGIDQSIYPSKALRVAKNVITALNSKKKIFVLGDTGAQFFADKLSVKCNYDRGRIDNVFACAEILVGIEKGDVVVSVDSNKEIIEDSDAIWFSITREEGHAIAEIVERCMFGRIAVFFDRDDTINDDIGHCKAPEDIRIFPFVGSALKKLNDKNILTIMVTNQSVIGRGQLDENGLEVIHQKVINDCFPGKIDDIFYCPHLPNAKCSCRKPRIGMAIEALKKYNINTFHSYMIGDSDNDILFGEAIGCKSYKVSKEYTFADAVSDILIDIDNRHKNRRVV